MRTHQMIRHLRTRVGCLIRLIHAVHADWGNATAVPRRSDLVELLCCGRESWD
jgi:hypothetical protein